MKAFTISIPKPCHEDWNKMTPNQQGAHCAVCAKTVVDFSNKSGKEIIEVFEKKKEEKVCGRFAPAQLSRPVVSFDNSNTTSRLVKFAYALLLVFGAALFNGMQAVAQTVKGDVKVDRTEKIKMGKVVVKPVKPKTATTCEVKTLGEIDVRTFGEVVVIEQPKTVAAVDTIVYDGPIQIQSVIETKPVEEEITIIETFPTELNTTISGEAEITDTTELSVIEIVEPTSKIEMTHMVGMISYVPIIIKREELIEPIEEIETKETIIPESVIVPAELEIKATPNPSSGNLILSYNLENNTPVQIDLYDLSGKRVKILTQLGNQYAGKYNVSYNISDLPNGIYIATLLSGEKKATAKIILAK